MKENTKQKALIALIVAFAMALVLTLSFAFTGARSATASAENPYATGVNGTSEVVTKENKPAFKLTLQGGFGCRVAYENPVDITADFSLDLYDVSSWTVGEGGNSLFIAFLHEMNSYPNADVGYGNGVNLCLYHNADHTFKIVLYKNWLASPYVNNGAWYETPVVSPSDGDKLTLTLGLNEDNTLFVIGLNGQTVAVPADVFGEGKDFYPEATVNMNSVYMIVGSQAAGSITVSDPNAPEVVPGDTALDEYVAMVNAGIFTEHDCNTAFAKRAEIDISKLNATQFQMLVEADNKIDEAQAWFRFDTRIPFSIGTAGNGTAGTRLINVGGQPAYKLGLIPGSNGGFACRISSTESYDLTSIGFDILRASESIVQTTTDTAMQTFIGFTDGVNRYLTEYKTSLTLAFEHRVVEGSHSYKLLFCRGWFENTWLTDNGALYELNVTDPADDKLSIQFALSENGANLNVTMNDQSVALPMSLFGPGTNMYPESETAINNVYFIYGTMNAGNNSMVVANLTDSKTKTYQNTEAYKSAMGNLNEYLSFVTKGVITSAEDCMAAIEAKNAISVEGLRTYDVNYIIDRLNAYQPVLDAARTQFAAELLEFDLNEYEKAVEAIADTAGSFDARAKRDLINQELLAASPEATARVAALDAKFVEKTDAAAKAISADLLAKMNAADTANKIREAKAIREKFSADYMAFLSTDTLAEVQGNITAAETKLAALMTITDWSLNGNAIMTKTADNTLNFIGSAYAGINSTDGSVLPQNDAMFYDKAFQVTNFSMDFTLQPGLTSGWFGIALMAKKGDVFSAEGQGEAATGKHKGLMIWLQPKANNRVGITVFAIKDDSLQVYAARKTEMLDMVMPADGKFNFRMFQAEGSNELSMMLNNTNILESKIRIPELNNVYGQQKDPVNHKGYLAITNSVGNAGEYFDFAISKINGKNVFAADITTPDPSNVPAKPECDHEYDPETGYCNKCGELDPDFKDPANDGKKGCGGTVAAASVALAVCALAAVAVVLVRKQKN